MRTAYLVLLMNSSGLGMHLKYEKCNHRHQHDTRRICIEGRLQNTKGGNLVSDILLTLQLQQALHKYIKHGDVTDVRPGEVLALRAKIGGPIKMDQ